MANPTVITDVEGKGKVTIKAGAYIARGQLLGYNSGWVLADSDNAARYFAQWIALEKGEGGDVIRVCKRCTLYDEDAPYTANTAQYLSGTAGALTETMPATASGNLVQMVGRSLDTYRCRLELAPPRFVDLWFEVDTFCTTGEPGIGTVDTGWTGPQLDAAGEDAYIKGRLPSNMVELLQARILLNSIAATAVDLDLTIGGGFDGADNNQDTGAAQTTADFDSGADDKLCYIDIAGTSHLMDAGFAHPGRNFSVWVDTDGVTGGDVQVLGVALQCLVV